MEKNATDTINKKCKLTLFFFILIIMADWLYIFTTAQKATIITHLSIMLPMLIPLFSFLTISSSIGIYLSKTWGFLGSYITIFSSTTLAIIAYFTIPREIISELTYVIILSFVNMAVIFYIIYNEYTCSKYA